MDPLKHIPLNILAKLSRVGIALSAEKDHGRLLELILKNAKELTDADGGTLYLCRDDRLSFEIMISDSLGMYLGGSSGKPIKFAPLRLYDTDGQPNLKMVATCAAVTGKTVNIPDSYHSDEFDFSGTRKFDKRTGYRSRSFLTVPMRDHEDQLIGVLQLINAVDRTTGEIVPFGTDDQLLAESLASQAAISLTNKRLIAEHRHLFQAFIELIAGAIDDKSPYTGGHCRRVPVLAMMLAEAAERTTEGPLRDFSMTDEERQELAIAAWLHDCGKVTTPEYVVDKATKLETIFDRIHLLDTRFEVLKRDAELEYLKVRISAMENPSGSLEHDTGQARQRFLARLAELDEDRAFIRRCNIGAEFIGPVERERIQIIANYTWTDSSGQTALFLSPDEVENLCIQRGTLNSREREVIQEHIVVTQKMLESLPYPNYLSRVPEFAGCHHERMDGNGYPRGLTREQMSWQARIMGIADIFEALTANDRPYKKDHPTSLSMAVDILAKMKEENHIDPDLFDVFIRERIFQRYADEYIRPTRPELVDDVDPAKYVSTTVWNQNK